MDAIDLLLLEHCEARAGLDAIANSTDGEQNALFRAFQLRQQAHASVEERFFYPAMRLHPRTRALADGDPKAHHAVERDMARLLGLRNSDPDWVPRFKALQAELLKHLTQEEDSVFLKVRVAFSSAELQALGGRMQAEYERLDALDADRTAALEGAPSQTFDPVCGLQVDAATAAGGACMQGGLVHYFCSQRCRSRFLAQPEAYAKGGLRALRNLTLPG